VEPRDLWVKAVTWTIVGGLAFTLTSEGPHPTDGTETDIRKVVWNMRNTDGEHPVPILGPPRISVTLVASYAMLDIPQAPLRLPQIG
jgi:hypothetical protein